jgi:lipoprotein-releasing system permease protein
MFELSVAFKYLIPRWRQLSESLISLLSVLVIALVIWLVVVFFSVTHGLEQSWIQRLIALTAPIRITPTQAYYQSYYSQIDAIAEESGYQLKTLREKLNGSGKDPYQSLIDGDLPKDWPQPDLESDGSLKDLVKKAYHAVNSLETFPGLAIHDFEVTAASLHLNFLRPSTIDTHQTTHSTLTHAAYLASIDPSNKGLLYAHLPFTPDDFNNVLQKLKEMSRASMRGDAFGKKKQSTAALMQRFCDNCHEQGVIAIGETANAPLWIHQRIENGKSQIQIPFIPSWGDGIILPKSFKDNGVRLGDQGHLTYMAPTATAVHEQQLPIYVAGFYDPGIISIGGKFILASEELVSIIHSAQANQEALGSNGFNVRFDNLDDVDKVKYALQNAFQAAGIAPYWHIETYREFEFTKDLIQQLHSERNLWTLLATVIILVACSNILSMLIILVNDKHKEIGILRSMGATSTSIAAIFGLCGITIGMVGSLLGMLLAWITLQNLQILVAWIGALQGHEMFNPLFYGNALPSKMSGHAIAFVLITTTTISLISGLIPAIKACMLRPATILRGG